MRVEDGFQPIPYPSSHPYTEDPVLPNLLRRLIPDSVLPEIEEDLIRFGHDLGGYIRDMSTLVHPPQLTQYDQWGRRIDHLKTSEGWRKLKGVATCEGLVAIHHERKYGDRSRIYGFAKTLMFSGDAHMVMCPLSMTDGAARVLELLGTDDMKREIRPRLISRDPSYAFTSGQWMTERPGGSDVSQTETTAEPLDASSRSSSSIGTSYTLNGFKWFSSATDSEVAVALARTGSPSLGSRSLSLFLVPLRLPLLPTPGPSSISNGILVHRLKNKFGTHALPTAELSLNDTKAYLLSPLNQGVRSITPVLNITRMHSAVGSIGYLRRAYAIARSYATVRSITVPGTDGNSRTQLLLKDIPLHVSALAKVGITYQALSHLTFGGIALLGKSECGTADRDEETRLRLLTPAIKAFVADRGVSAMEECMAGLGGQGYMEENVIGRLIRDGSVERIWEGTINVDLAAVLSLDLIRASQGNQGITPFVQWANGIINSVPPALQQEVQLDPAVHSLKLALEKLTGFLSGGHISPLVPRPILYLFAHTAAALYLLEHTVWGHNDRGTYASWGRDAEVFKRWVMEGLDATREEFERVVAFGGGGERERKDLDLVYGFETSGTKAKL